MPYNKYLTEDSLFINDKLDAILSQGLKPCLVAPTGTGKTTLVYERMQKEASKGYLSILALPYKSIVDNKRNQADDYEIISGYSNELDLKSFSQGGKAVQTTYEGALLIKKNTCRTDVKIYKDETHVQIENSQIRNSCSELLDLDCDIIGMTATPLHLEDIGYTIYEPKRAKETPRIDVKVRLSGAQTSAIVKDLINGHNKEESVLQIRINNKDEIAKACDLFKENGLNYAAIYTVDKAGLMTVNKHSGLTEAEVLDAQKGVFSSKVDIIINTSKMDCGLDFKFEGSRRPKLVAIGNRVNNRNTMPSLVNLAQASNRMRWENVKDADVTIIGLFGDREYKSAKESFAANRRTYGTSNALEFIKEKSYDATQFYTEDEYRRILAKYSINLLGSKVANINETKARAQGESEVLRRLNQFKGFKELQEKAIYYGFDLLQYCIEDDNIKQTTKLSTRAQEIISQLSNLLDSYEADAPINDVWTGKTYSTKNVKAFISVARAKKSKNSMGNLINRAEVRGELLKADYNGLVKGDRDALRIYLQKIHKVKSVKISDKSKKTIKLNIKGKEASSVVTANDSHLRHIENSASKSLVNTPLTNEQINAHINKQQQQQQQTYK